MLLSCVRESAMQKIVLLQPEVLAFGNLEVGEFFPELLKKYLQEKDEESRKQKYTTRKQGRNEDLRKYYTDRMRLWVQAYSPAKRSLIKLKMLCLWGCTMQN